MCRDLWTVGTSVESWRKHVNIVHVLHIDTAMSPEVKHVSKRCVNVRICAIFLLTTHWFHHSVHVKLLVDQCLRSFVLSQEICWNGKVTDILLAEQQKETRLKLQRKGAIRHMDIDCSAQERNRKWKLNKCKIELIHKGGLQTQLVSYPHALVKSYFVEMEFVVRKYLKKFKIKDDAKTRSGCEPLADGYKNGWKSRRWAAGVGSEHENDWEKPPQR